MFCTTYYIVCRTEFEIEREVGSEIGTSAGYSLNTTSKGNANDKSAEEVSTNILFLMNTLSTTGRLKIDDCCISLKDSRLWSYSRYLIIYRCPQFNMYIIYTNVLYTLDMLLFYHLN
jgi:hypothetical protein